MCGAREVIGYRCKSDKAPSVLDKTASVRVCVLIKCVYVAVFCMGSGTGWEKRCTMYSVQYTMYMYNVLCTMYSIQCTEVRKDNIIYQIQI